MRDSASARLGERALLGAVVLAAAVVVIVFAALQYRWTSEMREAASVRLGDTLQLSMVNWHLDFLRNFSELSLLLRAPDDDRSDDAQRYRRELEEWRTVARYPGLVSAVYLTPAADRPGDILQLHAGAGRFGRISTPPGVRALLETLDRASDPESAPPPGREVAAPLENYYRIGDALRDWRFDPVLPALVHPLPVPGQSGTAAEALRWAIIELDDAVIRDRILPDLAHRYFQGTHGLDYEVAVLSGPPPAAVMYESDPGFGSQPVHDADGRVNVFGPQRPGAASSIQVFHSKPTIAGPATSMAIPWFPLVGEGSGRDWQLVVRHRRGGPLGAFVAGMHRRYLGISFGALLLLAVSMGLVMVASNRARRLAKLQMDFVTAVSHELRTPLTVISSAADNIAQGVVRDPDHMTRYGAVISGQVRQLSGLVEQILDFAAATEGRRFALKPVDIQEVIDVVLGNTAGLIQAAHFTVERDIEPGLPGVTGDVVALSQCLQNLITNALKYGKAGRWIGIRAVWEPGVEGGEVQVSVSDRGMGIEASELSQVFEPFYRSRAAKDAQIHGTGLGLAVARQIAEAMKGKLSVVSRPGEGSTFTLHLRTPEPAGDAAAATA